MDDRSNALNLTTSDVGFLLLVGVVILALATIASVLPAILTWIFSGDRREDELQLDERPGVETWESR